MYFFLSIPVFCWKGKASSSHNVTKSRFLANLTNSPKQVSDLSVKLELLLYSLQTSDDDDILSFFLGLLNIFVCKYVCQIYIAYGTSFYVSICLLS
jgi:hypothetical protein